VKSVDAHLDDVLSVVGPLSDLDLSLLDAHGCVLAEDIVAPTSLPSFDNSSMDGYAVRAADVATATENAPVRLPVVGDIAAGSTAAYSVQPGLCVRIMTGAPMPPGADAIVPVEWTDGGVSAVEIRRAPEPGVYIRRVGEDVREGERVLEAGARIRAAQIALIAAVGRSRVRVRPKPRVVVISTGSELIEVGAPTRPGTLYDSNSFALTAAAREAGALAFRVGIVPDDPQRLMDAIEDQLVRADLIVTSGGVSAGAYDVVKEVLGRLGTVRFERVAMQPGMPQGFGVIGEERVPFFGLPGNPVSSMISFEVFVRPAIRRMLGAEPVHRPRVRARLTEAVRSPAGKRQYVRARLDVREGEYAVTPVGGPGSHLIAGYAAADSLIEMPEDTTDAPAGSVVTVMLLERRLV
jgi:molybdopterin molybdotransferase